jgi:hypothetical protein
MRPVFPVLKPQAWIRALAAIHSSQDASKQSRGGEKPDATKAGKIKSSRR